jgi:four helix bundle protein
MLIKSYKDLIVWQKSIALSKLVYQLTRSLPIYERYGLGNQMQRSAVSIASNIAEGYGRRYKKEYVHLLSIAFGSATELETQIIIAKEVYKVSNYEDIELLLTEIQKMLSVLINKLRF